MKEIIKNVILSGQFELTDMLKKINVIWIQGDITEQDKEELIKLARENANPIDSYAPFSKQLELAFNEINILKEKVSKLEIGGTVQLEPETGDNYPEYKQPIGAHDAYHKDDKITYNGEHYICVAPEDFAVVWNPSQYPAYWKKIE